ncbi:MAG: 30S ribosomal protein S6 [Verrucomicrobia bacterium]|nr:30S ribosomal protein S6 [Verrucomicrobiota bacterium]
MRKYEGLFILNTAGREEGLKETIDRLSTEITKLGAKIETVQRMEKKAFARVADKRSKEGYYVNFILEAEPATAAKLSHHFDLDEDVFRLLITTQAPAPAATKAA